MSVFVFDDNKHYKMYCGMTNNTVKQNNDTHL